jgi:hypothetical protein
LHPYRSSILTLFLLVSALLFTAAGENQPPTPASPDTQRELSAALALRLQAAPEAKALTFSLFTPELDTAFLTPDGTAAVLWLALRDDAGHRLATEPGLSLAVRSGKGWQVLLPGDPGWKETLAALPDGMLPLEQSPAPDSIAPETSATADALTGYYLPYAAGTSHWLEGSISHFQYIPSLGYPSCTQEYCQYAYDFTDTDHYPLLASKDGSVVDSRDQCWDGSENCTNFIVLYNADDQAYQIYLHLSYGTIPDKLTPGTAVQRGEYLGDTDDTGYSTSQHVHFMVTKSIWVGGDGYYWGRSVKIQFADVAINNGTPRTCYEVTHFPIYDGASECLGNISDPLNPSNDWYLSGNVGAYPPVGTFTRPLAGKIVATGPNTLMDVTAMVSDDVAVTAVRLLAKLGGQWVEVGPRITQPVQPDKYDWDVDLCAIGPLNGPLEIALHAWDHEGNVSGLLDAHTIQVDHACLPPTSQLQPAETFHSTAVHLNWDASAAGAGISAFELQWSPVPGAWDANNTLLFPANQHSAWFAGQPGMAYAFRLRAFDLNNQPEPWPGGDAAETGVILPELCDQDGAEPDDDVTQAKVLDLGEWAQRNLCGAGNLDWFSVDIANESSYLMNGVSQNGGAAVRITVYAEDGTTVLANSAAAGISQNVGVRFHAAAPGRYYIKVDPLVENLMGTDAVYRIAVWESTDIFLPVMAR